MYVANTHLKPVIGIDLHFVNLPFPFVPMPHPYIGLVIDPFDYLPFIGATVKVNNVPRGNTDTAGMIITFVHIPFGAGFTLMPIIGHDSQNFFGNKKVTVDGAPMSGAGFILMTCNDIGLPLSLRPGKKFIPIPSLYLPTSYCIPLQWGKPVMVNGPLEPNFSIMALLKSFAFGSFLKGFGKGASKMLKKLNSKLGKSGFSNKLGTALCKMGFEPVDLVTGRVNYEYTDFELPGPIPLKWTRNWDSDASFESVLGHGTHLCYDRYIKQWSDEGFLSLVLADGRLAAFPLLYHGESFYHPQEKILLRRKQNGHFLLEDYNESLYYHFNYDAEPGIWRLSFIENYSGNRIQFHYAGRYVRGITDSAGRKLLFELDKEHRITGITVHHRDKEQVLATYGYNETGDLVQIADALGQVTSVEYEDHLMIKKTDRNGQSFYWEYDDRRRCVHTWGDGGLLEGFIEYGIGYNTVTNSVGETTTYYFDENNLCIQETDHYGNHVYTEYTEDFNVYREIDEEGNVTGYTYDERSLLKEKIQPDGSRTQYYYEAHNNLSLILLPGGSRQTLAYDEQRRLRFINYPNGEIIAYEYNADGQLDTIVETGGRKTKLTYDEDENLTALQLPNGAIMHWKYDALGRCIQSIDESGKVRFMEYDALNRLRQLHLPNGNLVNLQYNAYEEVVKATDRYNQVQFEYTALGKITKRRQQNTEMQFLYDTEERLHTIVNEAGRRFMFDYNKRGEVIGETGFDGQQLQFERDTTGKLIKITRPGGRFTQLEYDANGRVIRTAYHDGSWEIYNYDRNDNLAEAVNEHSTVRFTYNKLGVVESETQDGYTVESTYDTAGNRIRITSNLGAGIEWQYDKVGLTTGIKATVNELPWQAQMKYNPSGLETERQLPGGLLSEWQYDHAGTPQSHKISSRGVIQSWKKYTWDANDRLVGIFDAMAKTGVQFKHDTLSNLVFAQYADNSIVQRTADNTGNIYETSTQTDRKYSAAGALLESKKYKYSYDEEGNLLSKTDKITNRKTQYEWNANGTLKKVIRPDGKTVLFTYDALGRRIAKTFAGKITRWVWNNHAPLHEWTYDENDKPTAVVNEWGEMQYDREEPNPVNAAASVHPITWIFEEDRMVPAAKIENEASYSILCDHAGTPQYMFDANSKKVWEGVLDIYGRIRTLQGSAGSLPFRYQGQYEDVETGLYYNRFRYYSPEEGLYISQDPIRIDGSNLTFYAYVHDPNTWVDVFGLTGTYVFQFDQGETYIGKGPHGRFQNSESIRTREVSAKRANPKIVREAHMDWGNDKMGYMVEYQVMRNMQYGSNPALLNRINTKGRKYYHASTTTDHERWLVRKRAKQLIKQFKKSRCK